MELVFQVYSVSNSEQLPIAYTHTFIMLVNMSVLQEMYNAECMVLTLFTSSIHYFNFIIHELVLC
jgi:hypothetical protein